MPAKKLSHEKFLERVKQGNPHFEDFEFLSEYTKSADRIKVRCKKCGYIWNPTASGIPRGRGCPKCARIIINQKNRITHEEFLERIKYRNSHYEDFVILNKFNGYDHKLALKCKKYGHEWITTPSSLITGTGCPKCAIIATGQKNRITHEEFLERIKYRNSHYEDFEFLNKFNGYDHKLALKCKKYGHEWETSPRQLIQCKTGCPKCSHLGTSFMEQFLYNALCDALGKENVLNRDKSAIGKELDIYIPSKKFAIEIGSWYWHKNIFKKDMIKYKLCQDKGIKLLIIYDACKNEFPKDINYDFIWTYDNDLASEDDHISLKDIFNKCLKLISEKEIDIDFKIIENNTYYKLSQSTHDIFMEKFKNKNKNYNNIEILSKYKGVENDIYCKCKKCGYEWVTKPDSLLSGRGCKKCFYNTKSKKSEVLEWHKNNPLGRKRQCIKETGLSYTAVSRWWNYVET